MGLPDQAAHARQALIRAAFALLVIACAALPAQAAQPAQTPVLRVDTTMHTARVRKLIHDAPRNRLLTASDDKTVRLWQLPKGRLLRVFRVPIGDGFEGRVYAADMHPDGRIVAAGGWTGWDVDGTASVYLFDADTGEITRRLPGFPETIGTLAFSPDGRHLAVGLLGAKGLRILRVADGVEVARDLDYGDRILDASFAADGRLAVASLDGYLRLYDASFKLIGRRKTTTGAQPLSIKFSPDGARIAVGFQDLAPPAIYRAADLLIERSVDATGLAGQRRIQNIQWSDDGESLYATGEQARGERGRIVRWRSRGTGRAEPIELDAQRPGSLWPIGGGRMAFAAEDPWIGALAPDGRVSVLVAPDVADLRDGALSPGAEAGLVRFRAGGAPVELNIRARTATKTTSPAAARARPAGWTLDEVDGRVRLNGTPIALDDYEFVRTSTVLPDERAVLLGTEWSVRALDRAGKPLWRWRASGVVWQIAPTDDGRSVIAAVSDGTLRWLRVEDGVEYLAAYVHPATLEWIAWTPQGYYVSSAQGDRSIGWHLNREADRTPLFYRAVQFERLLYRPDVVDAALAARDPKPAVQPSRRQRAFDVAELRRIAPPRIHLAATGRDGRATLRIEAEAVVLPMRDLTVYVNNMPVTPARQRDLAEADARSVAREVEVELGEAENVLRVEASNGEALGLAEVVVDAPAAAARALPPGDLYVLAVGINRFPKLKPNGQSIDLDYAARDAQQVAEHFRINGPRQFRNVHVKLITDDAPATRESIVAALDTLADAGPRDTVVLFLASHGVSDSRGNYYFVPADATTGDWMGAIGGLDEVPTMIHWSVFSDALRRASGRRLLIVDTCHARAIEGRPDMLTLAKRSASSLFALVSATKASEESQEFAAGRHGLFTYALLESLRGAVSDADKDGVVTLQEAFARVVPIVEKNRYKGAPQTPQLQAPWPLERTALVRVGR